MLHVTHSKNVLKMFTLKHLQKLQSIFSKIEYGLKIDSGYM